MAARTSLRCAGPNTLDPLKLARFPLETGTLMTGMFVAGISWLPGIATVVVSVGTAIFSRSPAGIVDNIEPYNATISSG